MMRRFPKPYERFFVFPFFRAILACLAQVGPAIGKSPGRQFSFLAGRPRKWGTVAFCAHRPEGPPMKIPQCAIFVLVFPLQPAVLPVASVL